MPERHICLFASDPDLREYGFMVQLLTGSADELARRALELGYDGFEYLPNPERLPDPAEFARALEATGAILPVVNTGRMAKQNLMLFDPDPDVAARSRQAFKKMLDFAGALGARLGLGIARGPARADLDEREMNDFAEGLFRELAAHAEKAGTVILLEPAETAVSRFILTVSEVMQWVERIDSPGFGVMLDTQQLSDSESSIEAGIRAARGLASHIHLYDRERWPPGLRSDGLDWGMIFRVLNEEKFEGTASVAFVPEGDSVPAARQTAGFLKDQFVKSA